MNEPDADADQPMLRHQPLGAVLEAMASRAPSPGSGAAAGIALAMAAACTRKAALLSVAQDQAASAMLTKAAERLAVLMARALADSEIDATCFPELLAAMRADDRIAERESAAALVREASGVVALAGLCGQEVDRVDPHIKPSLANDLLSARALLAAARTIASANAADNARALR